MSTQVQYRRGTATENNAFTGALAEITVDTTNWTLRVHDGATAGGGGNIATVAYVTAQLAALSANAITFGTSNVQIPSSGGNIRVNVGGTSNVAVFSTTGANIAGTLGVTGNISGGNVTTSGVFAGSGAQLTNIPGGNVSGTVATATTAGTVTTAAQPNITSVGTLSSLTVTANVAGGNVTTTGVFAGSGAQLTNIPGGNVSGTVATATTAGTVTTAAQPNITSVGTLSSLAVTANISGGNLSVSTGTITGGNIVNANANGIGNIGSSTTYFNTVFAKATSAQYADLAEMYVADANYQPGTVLEFGGNQEVTATTQSHSTQVAGIVSTNPSYLMNATQVGEYVVAVALTGRVPCRVQGPVRKGDVLVSSDTPGVAQRIGVNWQPGCTVGKAMEIIETSDIQVIEVAVGRL